MSRRVGRGSLLADIVDAAVHGDERIRQTVERRPMRDPEVGDEGIAVAEPQAMGVAFVWRPVDAHHPGDDVVLAAVEVMESLVLLRPDGHEDVEVDTVPPWI